MLGPVRFAPARPYVQIHRGREAHKLDSWAIGTAQADSTASRFASEAVTPQRERTIAATSLPTVLAGR